MAPSRRKKASAAAAAAAAQWKVGDLVLAKMKGFPAWPAMISEPEKWGLGSVKKKLLVYFYGTKQIAFCNYADLEAFTEEKKKTLLAKRQGKGADFVRAVEEIVSIYEDLKKQNGTVPGNDAQNLSTEISDNETLDKKQNIPYVDISSALPDQPQCIVNSEADESMEKASSILDELRQAPFSTSITTKKRNRELQLQNPNPNKRTRLQQNANPSRSIEDDPTCSKINCTIPDLSPRTEVSEAGSGTSTGVGTGACDLPPTMVCFKRKRRPNRKRASTGIECSDKENNKGGLPDSVKSTSSLVKENNESAEVLSDSPNSRNNDVNKSDGDEHLPLVKRARVRMERSLVEEPKPNPIPKPNGDLDFFTVKTNGYVEAALPPSKRLHRALEAMSANVAEKREVDQTETTGSIDSMPNGHTQLLESSKLPPPVSPEAQPGIIFSSICDRSLKEDVILPVPEPSVINVPKPNVVHLPDPSTVPVWKPITVPDQMSAPLEIINKSETLVKFISSLGENKDGPVEPTVQDACHTSSSVNDTKREVGKLVENNGPASSSENDAKRDLAESAKDLGPVSPSFSDIKMNPITEVAANLFSMKNSNTDTKKGVPAAPAEAGPLSKPVKGTNIDVILPLAATVGSMRISDNDTKKEIFNLAENVTLIDGANRGIVESALNLGPFSSFDNGAKTLVIGKLTPNVVPCSIDETKRDVTSIGRMSNFVYEIKRDVIAEPSANLGPPSAEFRENSQAVERHISPLLTSQESIPKAHPRDKCISPESTPMKDLIAAAQAKRILSRCFSVSENHIDSKTLVESPIDSRDGSSVGQPSPLNPAVRQSDCRTHTSGARSHAEAHAARKAFEAFLCTLTRTKDSIGRATRLAMECAKYGNAGEVMDIIIENVEKESNLHKRIDFFFLADSIMQWSRSQKGGPGDVYPSLVQSVFPRLMTLVAPPGVSAWENRKQCLKVLKLWMERKTLPEYLIRQHIRELESMNEASFSTASIRRGPTRTERAINDPLREMDGMLVDEYGSNTSFQLPPEFRATLLEVEGEEGTSSDEEREFEAVTPERDPHAISPNTDLTQMTTPNSSEKHTQSHAHTLVLAEVDGELEMEDVAPPPCDLAESLAVSGADSLVSRPEAQVEGSQEAEFAPPLPEDRPPSPPPLPSSPPPPPSLPPPPPPPQTIAYNPQIQPPSAVIDHSTNPNQATSKPMQFYNPAYRSHHPTQLPPPPPPPPPHGNNHPVSNHSVNNNFRQPVSQPPLHNNNSNNGYHMQPPPPPPPPVQNRYGYPQPEGGQHQPWKGPSRHSYPDNRYHPYSDVRDNRGSPYGDGRGFRGAMHSEDAAGHYGPSPSDRAPGPCAGWSMPPRIPPYPLPPARPTVEAPVSRVPGAHSYWRPR